MPRQMNMSRTEPEPSHNSPRPLSGALKAPFSTLRRTEHKLVDYVCVLERSNMASSLTSRIAEIPEEIRTSKTRVPWLTMMAHPPFAKLLLMLFGWSVAYGGMTAFTVDYLRTAAGMAEGKILLVTSVAYLGGLCSLWFLGSRLDRLGSKPVLTFCFAVWFLVLAGWLLLAGCALPIRLSLLLTLQFLMGLLAALVQMSNTRLAMALIPVMGRNHFFAIYSVVGNVTLGLAPIGWGLLIDAVGTRSPPSSRPLST